MTDKIFLEQAKKIIAENIYMTIATASTNGSPWISPVFFAYDGDYNLFWVSNKESRHSKLIQKNPRVAMVVFNSQAPEGEGDGVYFEAKVEELNNEEEINFAINILNKRVTKEDFRVKKTGDVVGNNAWRIYKARPVQISKLTSGETVSGQYIDTRAEINISDLAK